jgi:hypothetical protein
MEAWAGIALALRAPEDDALHSRLSTYLHPLAGRSLAWHALSAIAAVRPAPTRILLLSPEGIERTLIGEVPLESLACAGAPWWSAVRSRLPLGVERLLLVDAAAATLSTSLTRLIAGPTGRVLIGEDGKPLAVWIARAVVEAWAGDAGGGVGAGGRGASLGDLAGGLEPVAAAPSEGILVRDRGALARAAEVIRDRLVGNLLAAGVTFLLPESVLVDLDVRIGADTVIYPGVILEGQTTIGAETVVGPGCRIIDSWIGSGVELKGWNYIVGANIRNRAVLEPYVRRGFD